MTATKAPPIQPDAIFERAWRVSHELSDTGELILFDETASEVVMFNQVGACVWDLIDGERSVREIIEFIVHARQNPEEHPVIERDVMAFLEQLSERASIQLRG